MLEGNVLAEGDQVNLVVAANARAVRADDQRGVVVVPRPAPPSENPRSWLPTTSGAWVWRAMAASACWKRGSCSSKGAGDSGHTPGRDGWGKAGRRSRRWARRSAGFRRCRSCTARRPVGRIRPCAGPTPGPRPAVVADTSRLGWTRTAVAVGAGLGGGRQARTLPPSISRHSGRAQKTADPLRPHA